MRPAARSKSLKKIYRRTPSGRISILLRKRKKKVDRCEICKREIKIIKDKRILGTVCGSCLSSILSYYTRVINNDMDIKDVDLKYRKYVEILMK